MNTKDLLTDARAENLKTVLGFQTDCGSQRFESLFSKSLSTNPDELIKKQRVFFEYKQQTSLHSQYEKAFQTIKEIEPTLQTILAPSSLEKESMEQILFSKNPHLQILNTVPFLLFCVCIWKQYIVPVLALMMPLFFFLVPYLTMKYCYNIPLQIPEYLQIMRVTLGIPESFDKLALRQMASLSFTMVSLVQSIYQPIQTSFHIQKIDGELQAKTKALLQLKSVFTELYPENIELLADISEEDPYRSFASAWDISYRLQIALWMIGDKEVIHRIALHPNLQPVQFQTKRKVVMVRLINPLLDQAKPISFSLVPKHSHCLVTGPNGGGKSTVLRCILLNIVFAQTLGVCFGESAGTFSLDPFHWIQSGIHLEDLPGKFSLFEREVQFASQALHRARKTPKQRGLLLFDELFHSTNPPDGERTARLFLEQVWSFPNVSSFISTHVFHLAEQSPKRIQKLCVPANQTKGKMIFTYTLQNGICKVSSVDRVLQKCGFFPPGKPGNQKE